MAPENRQPVLLIIYVRRAKKIIGMLVVCDADLQLAQSKINDCKNAKAVSIDVSNEEKRTDLIKEADIVISMLPPHLHFLVANDCLDFSKHLLTASYIDAEIKKLRNKLKKRDCFFYVRWALIPELTT